VRETRYHVLGTSCLNKIQVSPGKALCRVATLNPDASVSGSSTLIHSPDDVTHARRARLPQIHLHRRPHIFHIFSSVFFQLYPSITTSSYATFPASQSGLSSCKQRIFRPALARLNSVMDSPPPQLHNLRCRKMRLDYRRRAVRPLRLSVVFPPQYVDRSVPRWLMW
jgi:hypothetical protein